jgi:CO/xanthine dehydrogenase Mo-binding subunit
MTGPDPGSLATPEVRLEGRAKVTGQAAYAADVRRDGTLQAAFLRSPYPHALITAIDVTAARAMPGVRAVLTGADVRPARLGRRLQDWPVLAWDRVRCVGDRVAAVAADTLAEAEAALARIEVSYQELPGIFDTAAALAADAPALHPDRDEDFFIGGKRTPTSHPNIVGHVRHSHGDVDAGFAGAAHIFEHEFDVAPIFTAALEPRASLVWLEGDVFHVVGTNKSPFALRDHLASGLALDPKHIVIESAYIGGDFGGKGLSIDEYALTFLARSTGRPVRAVTRYADDMRASNTRHGGRIRLKTGVDADGRFLAHEARVVLDGGAYASGKPGLSLVPGESLSTLAGYSVPSARIEALTVYTNNVPAGNARAPGQPQNAFAAESHVDLIARALGIDPLELRLRNVIRAGDTDVHGERWAASGLPAVLERLRAETAGGSTRAGRGRGVGLGARSSPAGKPAGTVRLSVTAAGNVDVLTGVPDQGGGAYTMLQRVVAAELGLPLERVTARGGSTDETPYDQGVGGSRVTPVVGSAALAGAKALRARLEERLPGRPLGEQLAAAAGTVEVTGEYPRGENDHPSHSTYAYSIEVDVDRATGQVTITDAVLVADVGTAINPVALRGQLVGGFAFGLGQAVMEELLVQDGIVTTANLGDYKLPTTQDVPPLRIILLATADTGRGPFGAKSVGELANPAVGGAIANAVQAAAGARVRSLPVTAERVFRALQEAAGGA